MTFNFNASNEIKNICLIEEDYITGKLNVRLLHSRKIEEDYKLARMSKKLLKYQKEYYENIFLPNKLENQVFSTIEQGETGRFFNKFNKYDFEKIYSKIIFSIDINNPSILSKKPEDIYEEETYILFDSFKVHKTKIKNNNKEVMCLINEKEIKTDEGILYKNLFKIKREKIKTEIPGYIKEIYNLYFNDLVDYLMVWVDTTEQEHKIKKNILKDIMESIKQEIMNPNNKMIYRIKNHIHTIDKDYKYIEDKDIKEKKLSSLFEIINDPEGEKITFIKDKK